MSELVKCEHDSCPEWLVIGVDAHEWITLEDGEVIYCLKHCPTCEVADG